MQNDYWCFEFFELKNPQDPQYRSVNPSPYNLRNHKRYELAVQKSRVLKKEMQHSDILSEKAENVH